ncbi:hypothetical protein HDU78_005247 [Chytriomyces hyalinus]|nr:hypothetical protein HDU78_005247 [Chytriomyces hyalinus]
MKKLHHILMEMAQELATVDGRSAAAIQKIVKNKTGSDLRAVLEDPSSDLVSHIVSLKETLDGDVRGRRYLTVLGCIQPCLAPTPSVTTEAPAAIPAGLQTLLEEFKNSPKHANLLQFAEKMMSELNIELPNRGDGDLSDMLSDLVPLLTTVGPYVQEKVASGEIQLSELEETATSMLSKLQDMPEFSSALDAAKLMSGVMG